MLKSCSCYKNRINSVFSKNVDTLIAIKNDTLYTTTTTNSPDIYTNLANGLKPINDLMALYATGNIADINTVVSDLQKNYSNYAEALYALKLLPPNNNADYETIRQSGTTTLSGMDQFRKQNALYNKALNDIELLNYYKELVYQNNLLNQRSFGVFNDVNVNVIKVEIPPEYEEYIRQYNPPAGSVFDPDKLAVIIKNIKDFGLQITYRE